MAGSVELATAYVQLVPSAKGIEGAISSELGGPASVAGTQAGGAFGKGFNKAAAAGGAAGVAALVAGAADFTQFERQMNEVFTLIPSASQATFDQLTAQSKSFATEFGVLPNEVVPALYQAISAGVPTDNVFDFLETAQQAAKGGVTDLATAVDGITSVTNAYGAEVISAAEASDLMFTAVKGGKTDFGQLSSSLFNVIPTASSLGVEFGNITAALATMTAAGTPTSVATTQLRQLLIELSKSGSKTAKQFEELSGQSFRDFVAGGGDVAGALAIMQEGADEAGLSLADMFGSSEAAAAAQSLTGANAEKFASELTAAADAAGATETAFEQMEQGIGPVIDKLKAEFAVALIDLGDAMAPAVAQIATGVLGIVKAFTALPGPVRSAIVIGLTAAATFAAVAGPAAKAVGALKGLAGAFKLLSANPYVILIAATVALVILIVKNWDKIKEFVTGALDAIGEFLGGWVDRVKGVWTGALDAISGAVSSASDTVLGVFTEMRDVVMSVFTTISDFIAQWWRVLIVIFTGPLGVIVNHVTRHWDTIVAVTTEVFGVITGVISQAWQVITAVFTTARDVIMSIVTVWWDAMRAQIELVMGVVRSVVEVGWSVITAVFQTAADVISGIVNTTITPIIAGVGTAVEVLAPVWSAAWDGMVAVLEGIKNTIVRIVDEIKAAVSSALGPLGDLAGKAGSIGGGAIGFAGKVLGFDTGGRVPGPVGAPRLAVVHGGETVLPTHREPNLITSLQSIGAPVSGGTIGSTQVTVRFERDVVIRDERDITTLTREIGDETNRALAGAGEATTRTAAA